MNGVQVINESGRDIPKIPWENILRQTARALKKKSLQGVSFVFIDKSRSSELNYNYRKKKHPANVLAFREEREVVLTPEIIKKGELIRLIVHGLLHLEEYDHSDREEASKMEDLEDKILKNIEKNIV